MSGLTAQGFEKKTQAEILDEIERDQQDNISKALNQSTQSPLGQLNGIFSAAMGELWDALEAAHQGRRPDGSSGSSLTQLSLLTGTERRDATKTTVIATVNLDDGFSQAAGTMFAHVTGDPTRRFTNTGLVENSSGITNDFDVEFEAVDAGALACPAGSLEVIAEALTGWNSITNALDGVIGLDDETDEDLRLRRSDELSAQGTNTADAIRANILNDLVDNITHCRVLVNDTDATDANGLPPHSFEVIARGLSQTAADADAVAAVILANKPAGIQVYSSTSNYRTVLDSQGNSYSIGVTWVSGVNIYVDVELVKDESVYPEDGDDQVKAAVVALEDASDYRPGLDAVAHRIRASIFRLVPGVLDIPVCDIGTSSNPSTETTVAISYRQIAAYDTSRVTVVATGGTP